MLLQDGVLFPYPCRQRNSWYYSQSPECLPVPGLPALCRPLRFFHVKSAARHPGIFLLHRPLLTTKYHVNSYPAKPPQERIYFLQTSCLPECPIILRGTNTMLHFLLCQSEGSHISSYLYASSPHKRTAMTLHIHWKLHQTRLQFFFFP